MNHGQCKKCDRVAYLNKRSTCIRCSFFNDDDEKKIKPRMDELWEQLPDASDVDSGKKLIDPESYALGAYNELEKLL